MDLRLGHRWALRQRLKNDLFFAMATFALFLVRPLPGWLMRTIGGFVGRIVHAGFGRARRTALANVARVFPELSHDQHVSLVRLSFRTLGECLGDSVALLHQQRGVALLGLSPMARELFTKARLSGRSVIFASAHLGPWERVAASLVAAGVPLCTIARESYDPRFTRLYERLRGRHGVGVIWRERPGAATRIVRTLRTGGVLGVPMDLRSRVASLDCDFLGHPAPTAVGPARLALRTGACVIVGSVAPTSSGRLEVTATEIETVDITRDDWGVHTLTERINAELSSRILAIPHAWVWMHERWPDR